MNDKLTHEESIELITGMINNAKRNIAKGGSFYFLLWGWVVFAGNLGHYLLAKFDLYPYPYIVWTLTIPAAIISTVYSIRQSKAAEVKSHLDRLYGKVWLTVFIGVVIILFFLGSVYENINAIILTFSAMGTFLSGVMLRFNPLIWGGIALWVAAIVAFNLAMVDTYLAGSIGILAGYLIPGYMLKKAEGE